MLDESGSSNISNSARDKMEALVSTVFSLSETHPAMSSREESMISVGE